MTFALPLCPPDRIEEAFTLLEDEINNLEHLNVQTFSRDYINYIRNTYMSGNYGTQGAWEWNFWNRMGEGHLTNNAAEGGNNRLATRMRTSHPGFYHFAAVINKELSNTKNKLEQFEAGNLNYHQSNRARTMQKSRMKPREGLHKLF